MQKKAAYAEHLRKDIVVATEVKNPQRTFSNLKKLKRLTTEKGLTLVPMTLFFKGAWVKLEFAVGKGKKRHDKRETLKKKAHASEQRNHR